MRTTSTTTIPARWCRGRGWAYTGALLGGAVSIAANIAHSFVPPPTALALAPAGDAVDWSPPVGAVLGATFWPIALFVAVEILARTPWRPGARWVALRWVGLLPVAFVAAFVSYRHLSGLLAFYGEDTVTATLGPLAVDGLMVMASGALIATAPTATRHATEQPSGAADTLAETVTVEGATPERTESTGGPAVTLPVRRPSSTKAPRARRTTPTGTRSRVGAQITRARTRHPEWTTGQIAARVGVTERTVRRHLNTITPDPASTQGTETDAQDDAA